MDQLVFIALVIGVCVVLSFLFSGMEAGVLALSQLRIRSLMRAGNPSARTLLNYLDHPEDFLWTILIGNTVANFVAMSLLVNLLHRWLGQWPVLLLTGFLALVFSFYAFCELLPKLLFRLFPNVLTLALATPFRLIHFVLSPLVWAMTKLSRGFLAGGQSFKGLMFASREEMRLVMQESAQAFSSEERIMINRVLDLQKIPVRDVAIPLEETPVINTNTPIAEALKISQEQRMPWLPVWRGTGAQRRIVGIVSLRALLYQPEMDPKRSAGDFLKPALYIEEEMPLEAALKRMQRSGQRLGIVLGHDRRETGIVTLRDILSVIFGEVRL